MSLIQELSRRLKLPTIAAGISLAAASCSTTQTAAVRSGTLDSNGNFVPQSEWAAAQVKAGINADSVITFTNIGVERLRNHFAWAAKQAGASDHCANQIADALCPAGTGDAFRVDNIKVSHESLIKTFERFTKGLANIGAAAAFARVAVDGLPESNISVDNNVSSKSSSSAAGGSATGGTANSVSGANATGGAGGAGGNSTSSATSGSTSTSGGGYTGPGCCN